MFKNFTGLGMQQKEGHLNNVMLAVLESASAVGGPLSDHQLMTSKMVQNP